MADLAWVQGPPRGEAGYYWISDPGNLSPCVVYFDAGHTLSVVGMFERTSWDLNDTDEPPIRWHAGPISAPPGAGTWLDG
jgi:hypothetical protein